MIAAIDLYTVIKFLHVGLAIVAVGFNASYGVWLSRASRQREHEGFALNVIKVLDDRFANPSYALLLVTGLIMLAISPIQLTDFWIAASLVLYAIVVLVGLGVYTPTLRRQIAVLEGEGSDSAEYRSLARRGTLVGAFVAILVVAIVFLMVTKPTL